MQSSQIITCFFYYYHSRIDALTIYPFSLLIIFLTYSRVCFLVLQSFSPISNLLNLPQSTFIALRFILRFSISSCSKLDFLQTFLSVVSRDFPPHQIKFSFPGLKNLDNLNLNSNSIISLLILVSNSCVLIAYNWLSWCLISVFESNFSNRSSCLEVQFFLFRIRRSLTII